MAIYVIYQHNLKALEQSYKKKLKKLNPNVTTELNKDKIVLQYCSSNLHVSKTFFLT